MRSLFIAFLIVLFAGVQTAAAFSNAHKDTTVSEQAMSVGQGAPDMVDAAFSHHAKCCEKSGKAGSIAKTFSCSADCLSYYVDSVAHQVLVGTTLETLPLHVRTSVKTAPHVRPPKHV
ncbi:hypothetical protein [Roseibium salinum]|uniref:Uncharacterized protein n=1 Tax=Roseibium salinum TaxID=1604349 RepID=A0ABT3R9J0_9HYPH|nr:hypothetical protein [Roseibium sp. DSM 29163]MCX2725734.1 hypothetical protein [Roseibium sp. DSM 29163]